MFWCCSLVLVWATKPYKENWLHWAKIGNLLLFIVLLITVIVTENMWYRIQEHVRITPSIYDSYLNMGQVQYALIIVYDVYGALLFLVQMWFIVEQFLKARPSAEIESSNVKFAPPAMDKCSRKQFTLWYSQFLV